MRGSTPAPFLRRSTSERGPAARPSRVDYAYYSPPVSVPQLDDSPAGQRALERQRQQYQQALRQAYSGIPQLVGAAGPLSGLVSFAGKYVAAAMVPYLQRLWDTARSLGIPVNLVSGYRSAREQAALRGRWEAGDPSVVSPPAQYSYHQLGLAVDIESNQLSRLGQIWEQLGGRWGGRFGDPVHFDLGRR